MKTYSITVQSRKDERAKVLRSNKQVPGVIYGSKFKNTTITCNTKELRSLFNEAGYSNLIDVIIEGSDKATKSIIQDVDFHPLSDEITHIDFYAIDMNKPITTTIPVRFTGESEAIKTLGGMFITNKDEIEIKCLPGDLLPFVEISIETLEELNDRLRVKDLKVPSTIEILDDEERTLAHIEEPRVQTTEETTEAAEGEGEGEEKSAEEGKEGEEEGKEGEKKE